MSRCLQSWVIAGMLVLGPGLQTPALAQQSTPPAASASTPSTDDGWRVVIYPIYGFVPVFGADLKSLDLCPACGGGSGDIKTSGNLNGAWASGVRVEKGRISVEGAFLWAGLSGDVERPALTLHVDLVTGVLLGGFEVAPALFVEGGVRRYALDVEATVLDLPPVSWKPGIWDPVIGATYRPDINKRLRLLAHVDVGGIGVPRDTLSGGVRVEWTPATHFLLTAGYGFVHISDDGTIQSHPISLSQTLHGPIVGVGTSF